jgi:ABC-2 type transport system ATP-binding protein
MTELCGLTKESRKKIGQLSKGYRQRVGLAQSLIHDPKVLILDEPTTGLDPNQIIEIRNLIKKISAEKTVILSTHIMQEVQAICDQVIILNQGRIVANDSLQNLKSQVSQRELLIAEFKQPFDVRVLEAISGVLKIESLDRNRCEIHVESKTDIRENILKTAAENNMGLVGLQKIESDMESVFRNLTN